ncbi:uncharacterized protein Triagg1_4515 [Trichoderma aggressivum f. europaeum]|uniref:Uncharacterized protein n=1 Tax=Trichoderma aggressivum f. europaeum TaxID=173218 RepID=A0AAE1IDM9_9HYPO|nr:hypothetical protein Triagg1_4515 [Trichoderma aggressivum f. europaeum]
MSVVSDFVPDGLEVFAYMAVVALALYIVGLWFEPFVHLVVMALRRPNGERWQYFRSGLGNAFADAVASPGRLLTRISERDEDE